MIALLLCSQYHLTRARLASSLALGGQLNTMIHRVAHKVNQRVCQGFHQVFIEIGLFANQFKVYFLFQAARQITHNPGETTKYFFDRLHARLHDGHLQISCDYI